MFLLLTRVGCGVHLCVSCLLALRAFALSYAIHFWVYLSQREVERTDLASQNHNFVLLHTEKDVARARDRNTARANQSASQDCRLATNQRLKSADLRQRRGKNRARFKTRHPVFGLGRVITWLVNFKHAWWLLRSSIKQTRNKTAKDSSFANVWSQTAPYGNQIVLVSTGRILILSSYHSNWCYLSSHLLASLSVFMARNRWTAVWLTVHTGRAVKAPPMVKVQKVLRTLGSGSKLVEINKG